MSGKLANLRSNRVSLYGSTKFAHDELRVTFASVRMTPTNTNVRERQVKRHDTAVTQRTWIDSSERLRHMSRKPRKHLHPPKQRLPKFQTYPASRLMRQDLRSTFQTLSCDSRCAAVSSAVHPRSFAAIGRPTAASFPESGRTTRIRYVLS
jgi:site-specific DNA-cytosine methylase